MGKHTPGPWHQDEHWPHHIMPADPEGGSVAKCLSWTEGRSEDYLDNARLIAAAPEMLEALKYARRFVNQELTDLAYIDEAIAKAEGE